MKIGAVIQLVEIAQLNRAFTFEEIKSTAIRCEEFGFDSLWVYDHLLYLEKKNQTLGIWEPWRSFSARAPVPKGVTPGPLGT